MKVAIDVMSQSPGHSTGALSWFLQFARAAPARDPETDYVYFSGREDVDYYRQKSPTLRVIGIGWGNSRRALRVLTEHLLLGPALALEDTDILFHGGSGVAPLFLPKKLKLVLAVWGMQHVADSDITVGRRMYRRLLFHAGLRRADAIVVNSAYTRDLLQAHYSDVRVPVEVVHHGVDLALFHPGPLTAGEEADVMGKGIAAPYVLFVGQLYPYKLLHILAEGFCRAVSRGGLPHRLVVCGSFSRSDGLGDGYRRRVEAILANVNLLDRLVLVEDVSVTQLRALYADAVLYVQSSAAETFGRTVIEAMACGAPVLAARAGATPEILGDAGIYYEAQDVQGCADSIGEILSNHGLRNALVEKGLARAQRYSYDIEVARLIELFHRVGNA